MPQTEQSDLSLRALGSAISRFRVHDVSPTITAELPVFFMYPQPRVTPLYEHAAGGVAANVLELAEHVGTHVDAPYHFHSGGATVDALPAHVLFLKPFKKFDLTANRHQPGELVELEDLIAAAERGGFSLEDGDVAVLEFGWDRNLPGGEEGRERDWWGRNQPGLSEAACEYLATAGIAAVACDTAACDVACRDGEILAAHGHAQHFLPNGILIVEGLFGLSRVPAHGLFVAIPLKVGQGTGSPVRVLLLTE
jgi:kynurenine formamidase